MATIRPTQDHDFRPIADLTNHFIRETSIHFGDPEVSDAEVRDQWKADRAAYPWLTIDLDGAFAGYAKAGVWRARAAYRLTAETAIYMTPEARGRKLGRSLYAALLQELRTRGFHTAVAGITLPNEPSVRVHEAVGFRYVATFREVGRKFDAWWDVGFWQIPLAT